MMRESLSLIFGGLATLEDLYELHQYKNLAFVIEDGVVKNVINE